MNSLNQLEQKINLLEDRLHRERGLQQVNGIPYKILKKGRNYPPTKGDTVTLEYTGYLKDKNGKKVRPPFDSTQVPNKPPFSFILGMGQVIPGWDILVAKMRVGEKIEATIPSHLAYGSKGAGGVIPPYSDLIFVMELIKIQKS